MSGTQGAAEAMEAADLQDLGNMARVGLPEPECPGVQAYTHREHGYQPVLSGHRNAREVLVRCLPESRCTMSALKGMSRAPTLPWYVPKRWNAGWPSRREPKGHGAAIVLVGVTPDQGTPESGVQGEARQGVQEKRGGWRVMR